MQSEQKVKVGLIKSAIKLSSAIKLLHLAINQKSQNGLRRQQLGNESVNTFHYCMITRRKIKSQNNRYMLDLTCLCIISCLIISHSAQFYSSSRKKDPFYPLGVCFCIFRESVIRGLILMNQGESTGSGANSRRYHMQSTSLREHIFGNFATKDAGTAVVHLRCRRKKGLNQKE